jgi:hypothetical protein
MELKDVILSTLAEMEETQPKQIQTFEIKETKEIVIDETDTPSLTTEMRNLATQEEESTSSSDSEIIYLNSIRERLLVLFEGFQAPNNTNIEAKMDLTLNFLEYVLSTIDARVEKLDKGRK